MDFLEFIKGLSLHGNKTQKRVVFYSLDTLHGKPFVYFTGIQRGDTLDAFPTFETKEDIAIKGMQFKGIYPFKQTDYHFYEIPVVQQLDTPTKQCKITLYEILYIRHVEGVPIDPSSINFIKSHSFLCILRDNQEVELKLPSVFYLAIPKACVKEQLFLPFLSDGIFKKGHYLYTHERCLELPRDHLFTLPNSIHLTNKGTVTQKKGQLYIENQALGPVPDKVDLHSTFHVEKVTDQWITLKTSKAHKMKEEWCVLRYLCNMEHHWIGPHFKKDYDSFSYDQTFKYTNPDHVRCISMREWD